MTDQLQGIISDVCGHGPWQGDVQLTSVSCFTHQWAVNLKVRGSNSTECGKPSL